MKYRVITAATTAAVAVSLSACAGIQGESHAVLQNLQGCERHYNGVVAGGLTGGSFSGSVKIDCAPGGMSQNPASDDAGKRDIGTP